MARPQKEGLDYFPLDVEMDDKVKLIDAKFGVAGFGILVKLWQIIYDNGYYIKWTEKELLLYKTRISADINLVNDVINECLRWGIFDNELYEAYSILTSSGIQKRYFEAVKRRTEITLIDEFIVAPLPKNYKPAIKVIPAVIVCKNSINVNINPQSKEKKSKVKKSKVKNNTHAREEKNQPKKIKYADFVSLTNAEYEALVAKLGEDGAKRCIEILDNYKGSTGRKYKSDYRTILNWVVQRYEEEQQRKKQQDKHKSNNPFLELAKEEGLL
jgi:hypothetical protein